MALTVAQLGTPTWTTATGVKTVAATPTLGAVIVVIVAASGVATALGISDNNADGHGAAGFYNQIVAALKNTSADNLAIFIRSQPIRSATATTWTTSGDSASTGGGLAIYQVTGGTITGITAVRSSGSQANQAATGTPATALGQAALTTNALIAAVFNGTNPGGVTGPTSWTRDNDLGYNTPASGLDTAHINSGFTGSTVTWGSTSASAFCDVAIELRAEQGNLAVSPEIPPIVAEQARNRAAVFSVALGDKWARRGRLWVPRRDILIPQLAFA